MKEIAISVATVAAALLLVAAAVFGARDTALFVPPPDAVAENFARELAAGRYELARRHLSSSRRREQGADDLESRFAPWKARIGKVDSVEAKELSRASDRAAAICEVRGDPSSVTLALQLVREQGLWRVDGWEAAAEVTR